MFKIIHTLDNASHTQKNCLRDSFFSSTEKVLTYFPRCAKGIFPFIVDHMLLWENQRALKTK